MSCSSPMCCAAIRSGSGRVKPGSDGPVVCLWVVPGALMATFGIRIRPASVYSDSADRGLESLVLNVRLYTA